MTRPDIHDAKSIRKLKKVLPEVAREIRSREIKMEHLINIYRMFVMTFLIVTVITMLHIFGLLSRYNFYVAIPAICLLYGSMIGLHLMTRNNKSIPLLKFITTFFDFILVFGLLLESKTSIMGITGISTDQYLMMASVMFISINGLAALRTQFGVIVFSTCMGICLNVLLHRLFNGPIFSVIFTSVFILISGFLNLFISGFIFRSFLLNHQLTTTLSELEDANRTIVAKNDEINAQNNELETQNDYLHQSNEEINRQKKHIVSSIEYASRIQQAVLDSNETIKEVAPDSFVLFKPRDLVSGDFYWFRKVEVFTRVYHVFTAVDCTGHGVPGAFMSMLGTSFLNDVVTGFYDELEAAEVLNRMREKVKKHLQQEEKSMLVKDGMDMALCAIDYDEMVLQFAGANNPLYIIRFSDGKYADDLEVIVPDKMPIGVYVKEKPSFTNHIIKVNKGDLLYIFSDGYVDQFGGATGDKFKSKRFMQLLLEVAQYPMPEQKIIIENRLNEWQGHQHPQIDDITVIGVKV